MFKTSENGIKLITHYESLHDGDLRKIGLQPKEDCSGYWTIGYGHLLKGLDGKPLSGVNGFSKLREIYPDYLDITIEEAEQLLSDDLESRENQLNSLNLNLNQNEFDALISFIYNCGFGNFLESRLLRMVKTRKGDIDNAFSLWNKSNGEVKLGLTYRRKTESKLFREGILEFYN